MDVNIKISKKVFNDVYLPYLDNTDRYLIFYGGGIKVNNVDLLHKTSIDGILVGAASLDNKDLEQIMFRWTAV